MFAESLLSLVGLLSLHAAQTPMATVTSLNTFPIAKYAAPRVDIPLKKNPESVGIEVTARAATVLDVASGKILFQKDAETAYPVASLTKLMTAMTFLDRAPNLDAELTFSPDDLDRETRAVFAANERMSTRDVLRALLVGSVNMAANTLARSTGDREAFIQAMNQKAEALGMRHALFVDPVGIGAQNQASAKDVALALRAALSYPEIREATELERVEINGRATGRAYTIKSTNLLLNSFLNKKPYRIMAGKTGSLPEAGFCLALSTQNEAGNEVIAVVLGSENHFVRFQDAKALTAWAFLNFDWPKQTALREVLRLSVSR